MVVEYKTEKGVSVEIYEGDTVFNEGYVVKLGKIVGKISSNLFGSLFRTNSTLRMKLSKSPTNLLI